jgi:hypothetical protein
LFDSRRLQLETGARPHPNPLPEGEGIRVDGCSTSPPLTPFESLRAGYARLRNVERGWEGSVLLGCSGGRPHLNPLPEGEGIRLEAEGMRLGEDAGNGGEYGRVTSPPLLPLKSFRAGYASVHSVGRGCGRWVGWWTALRVEPTPGVGARGCFASLARWLARTGGSTGEQSPGQEAKILREGA